MNKSTAVRALHLSLLATLVAVSLGSVAIRALRPIFYNHVFFPVFAGLVGLTLVGWHPRFGGCVLTTLEKKYLAAEGKPVYSDTFVLHNFTLLTGWKVRGRSITAGLLGLMAIPIVLWLI